MSMGILIWIANFLVWGLAQLLIILRPSSTIDKCLRWRGYLSPTDVGASNIVAMAFELHLLSNQCRMANGIIAGLWIIIVFLRVMMHMDNVFFWTWERRAYA